MNYQVNRNEFDAIAQAFDSCAVINNCDICEGQEHCDKRWHWLEDNTVPFNYFPMRKENPYPSKSESRYDITLLTAVLKRRGFNDDTLL